MLIRIYVACLAAYNNGQLHGDWIDANQDPEDIFAQIKEMLKASSCPNAEEFAIHDYDGFGGIKINEYQSIESVSEIARLLDEYGAAFAAYYQNVGDLEYAKKSFEDALVGCYKDEEDFAYEELNSLYNIPDYLECYIDYEGYAHDLFIDCYFSTDNPEGGIFVFRRIDRRDG